jgi:hypothetical protein
LAPTSRPSRVSIRRAVIEIVTASLASPMSNSPTSARLACAAPATRIIAARVNRSLGLRRIFSKARLRLSTLTTLTPWASSTSPIRIAKLSHIQLYLGICERFSNGITTTASAAVTGAFEDGMINENP